MTSIYVTKSVAANLTSFSARRAAFATAASASSASWKARAATISYFVEKGCILIVTLILLLL
jgi:hypothetical protein